MTTHNLFEAFFLKLQLNLKAEARSSYLNYAWWVLEPALNVALFYFVFEVLLGRGGEGFVVFLLCGQIPFSWFARSVNNASSSVNANGQLIQQTAIPIPFFPLLVVAQDIVKESAVLVCLLIFVWIMGHNPNMTWLALPVIVATQSLLIAGCSLTAAAITPWLPDFKFIIGTAMTMLMFASGIFYDYSEVLLEQHKSLFLLNPVASLIDCYRTVIIDEQWPSWSRLAYVAITGLGLSATMAAIYKRLGSVYSQLVIQ